MRLRWFALTVVALALAAAVSCKAYGSPAAAVPAAAQYHDHDDHDWDAPPSEFRDVQRQGFHDGIEGARKDFDNHRRPDVNNRDEYRHPHVSRDLREDYREGFRRGYERAMQHLMGDRH